jgi:hypothetical protein
MKDSDERINEVTGKMFKKAIAYVNEKAKTALNYIPNRDLWLLLLKSLPFTIENLHTKTLTDIKNSIQAKQISLSHSQMVLWHKLRPTVSPNDFIFNSKTRNKGNPISRSQLWRIIKDFTQTKLTEILDEMNDINEYRARKGLSLIRVLNPAAFLYAYFASNHRSMVNTLNSIANIPTFCDFDSGLGTGLPLS